MLNQSILGMFSFRRREGHAWPPNRNTLHPVFMYILNIPFTDLPLLHVRLGHKVIHVLCYYLCVFIHFCFLIEK